MKWDLGSELKIYPWRNYNAALLNLVSGLRYDANEEAKKAAKKADSWNGARIWHG
jgi:hypothetical protein